MGVHLPEEAVLGEVYPDVSTEVVQVPEYLRRGTEAAKVCTWPTGSGITLCDCERKYDQQSKGGTMI